MKKIKNLSFLFIIILLLTQTGCKKKFTITFKDFDGTVLEQQEVTKKTDIQYPKDPSRIGYTFIGWDNNVKNIKENTIINAQYEINKYMITFDTNGGEKISPIMQEYGTNCILPTPVKEGYEFIGWYLDNKLYDENAIITKDLTIEAKWNFKYTVGLEYKLSNDGTYYSLIGIGSVMDKHIVVPETYNSLPVTTIEKNTFLNNETIEIIELSKNIIDIQENPFKGCKNLNKIIVNENNEAYTIIDDSLYSKDGKILIQYAVWKKETIINISNDVVQIMDGALMGANELRNITIPFVGEKAQDTFNVHFGYIFGASSPQENSTYVPETLKEVIISGGIVIGQKAFYNCDGITHIEIVDGVNDIFESAFENCVSLTNIYIPSSVSNVCFEAFKNCSNLTSMTLPFVGKSIDEKNMHHFGYIFGAKFDSFNSKFVPQSLKEVIITGGTKINNGAFSGCQYIENITLPDTIIIIEYGAFEHCRNLKTINLSDNILFIDGTTFEDCASLESINIPNNLVEISYRTFFNCKSLKNVYIPNSVTKIDFSAFLGCTSLENIEIPNSVTTLGNSIFSGCTNLTTVKLSENLNQIPQFMFEKCTSLESIKIPNSVKSIGRNAFQECTNLKNIVIPDSVTEIGSFAFDKCRSLENIKLSNKIKKIESYTFNSCKNLKEVILPGALEIIDSNAFNICVGIENIQLPNGLKQLGFQAFFNCTNLKTITIPNTVTVIGAKVFENCENLESIYIPISVEIIESEVFKNCTKLTIYCEAESIPSDWNNYWNSYNSPVVWGYKQN